MVAELPNHGPTRAKECPMFVCVHARVSIAAEFRAEEMARRVQSAAFEPAAEER